MNHNRYRYDTSALRFTLLLLIFGLLFMPTNASNHLTADTVATATVRDNAIGLDSSETPYIYSEGKLYRQSGASWIINYITPIATAFPTVLLDNTDTAHVFYHEFGSSNNNLLYHATCAPSIPDGGSCPTAQLIETRPGENPSAPQYGYSLHNDAVQDVNGNIHLVYGYYYGYWGAFYTQFSGGSWSTPVRLTGVPSSDYMLVDDVSLKLDPDGLTVHTVITNRDAFQKPVGVYYGIRSASGVWSVETVPIDNTFVFHASLGLVGTTPYVIYGDGSDLILATQIAPGTWSLDTLFSGANGGVQSIDAEIVDGTLHVIFSHGSGSSDDRRPVYLTKVLPGGTPVSERVPETGLTQTPVTSMATIAQDIHISYNRNTTSLHYILVSAACSTTVTNINDSGAGSLRDAITCSNDTAGVDTIDFNIAGAGPHTIQPLSALPTITDAVIIDGTSQSGFAGTPVIEVDGSLAGSGVDGLTITAGDTTVRGLVINRFASDGIAISVGGNNIIEGNYIGTDVSGTSALGNGSDGILIANSANNRIGTDGDGTNDTAERNVISGNGSAGVVIVNAGATGNVIAGNYIGTNAAGDSALGHVLSGVVVAAPNNIIGGTNPGTGNLLSGNIQNGVRLDAGADGTVVQGNRIGTDATGTSAVPNQQVGVRIFASNTTVGGSTVAAQNIISGNGQDGIRMDAGATNNMVQSNYIGVDVSGNLALMNLSDGIEINATSGNTVDANVISSNGANGIRILNVGAINNIVTGNLVGTDATGMSALANGISGIRVDSGATNNTIGGTTAATRNVISGNVGAGVEIHGSTTSSNIVQGNYIGLDITGAVAIKNAVGVSMYLAPNNTVGGTDAGAGNVISGNDLVGVSIFLSTATGNVVQGNYIGTDATGTVAVGNGDLGINIVSSANNVVGGTTPEARNIVSGNVGDGIHVFLSNSPDNVIQGNYIGTDVTGTVAVGNGGKGIYVNEPSDIVISNNLISGNGGDGITASGLNHIIQGNYIGVDVTGTVDLGNDSEGIFIVVSQGTQIGGTTAGDGNIISGNGSYGIYLSSTTNVEIQGNMIGTDVSGTTAIGNSLDGIYQLAGQNTLIGGSTVAARNLISGNSGSGIKFTSPSVFNNMIQGNYIGTDATGNLAVANGGNGVEIGFDATNNTVQTNVISGNTGAGIRILSGANGNQILGNLIGTDSASTSALGNGAMGIIILDTSDTVIGGTTPANRNLISGNGDDGIRLFGATTINTVIQGNYVGTDSTGAAALPNAQEGIHIMNGTANTLVGGVNTGDGNLISGNAFHGIYIEDASNNVIEGNFVGTDATGTSAVGNSSHGVRIRNGADNVIGGTTAGAGNIISGNNGDGIFFGFDAATNTLVQGNFIGIDVSGSVALPNMGSGIRIAGTVSTGNVIGGTSANSRNVISGNTGVGVWLAGFGNTVEGNYIGTDATGTTAIGNNGAGIVVGSSDNSFGGATANSGNLIAHNSGDGITVTSGINNAILSNNIYENGDLGIDLDPNGVTANDVNDADSGANNLQNYPELVAVYPDGSNTIVEGTLDSTANTAFTVQFFSNAVCDPSGHGEGETFLGTDSIVTDGNDDVSFSVALPISLALGEFVTMTATDPDGNTSEFSACVVVDVPPNQAPVAFDASVTTDEDFAIPITLVATDDDGDTLIYNVSLPTNGVLSGTAPNLLYTPNTNFFGADSFTFFVNDGVEDSNTATVSITVNSVNDIPVADDATYSTNQDTPVAIILVANDPVEGDPLTYMVVANPANGVLSGTPPNLTYTPNAGFSGSDSFSFKANDGIDDSNTAIVSITVVATNAAPTANDDTASSAIDTPTTINVLANDTDPDMDSLSVTSVTPDGNGSAVINANNTITFTPNVGFVGTATLTYTISDGNDGIDDATVVISVQYNFTGFFDPVNSGASINEVKAGRAIPIKFSLNGDYGLDIFAEFSPSSTHVGTNCSEQFIVNPIGDEETTTAGNSGLNYDPNTDTYTYVWKTERSWAGTCRQFNLILNDGTNHIAWFEFD